MYFQNHTRGGRERGGEKRWPKKEVERPAKELCRAAIPKGVLQILLCSKKEHTGEFLRIG